MGCTAAKAAASEGLALTGKTLLTSSANGKLKHTKSFQSQSTTPSTDSGPSQARTPKAVGHVQGPGLSFGEELANDRDATATLQQPCDRAQDAPACPERLWLVSPLKPALQGEYVRLPAWFANGEPIWRHASGSAFLFSSSTGRWTVTDHHSKIEADQGEIRSADKHYHKRPHECSRWMCSCGSGWAVDDTGATLVTSHRAAAQQQMRQQERKNTGSKQKASLRAVLAPETLWVAVPPRPALQGEYRRVEGRMEHCQPVWRRIQGDGWLFSSAGGHWLVCSGEPGAKKNPAQLRSSATHSGKWPQEVKGWKYARSGTFEWVTDSVRAIQVSADPSTTRAALKNYDYYAGVDTPRPEASASPRT